jgi:hypothetical protein
MKELFDFPDEILIAIFSNLNQSVIHLRVAPVCKRFLQLTREIKLPRKVTINRRWTQSKTKSLQLFLEKNNSIQVLRLDSLEKKDLVRIKSILKETFTATTVPSQLELID